jgi:hypothetical protein
MEISEEDIKSGLRLTLEDRLYEICLDGHTALIGKEGYIDYLLRKNKIDKIVMDNNNDKNMTSL